MPTRLMLRPLLGELCRAIYQKRSELEYARTIWHDSGDLENAWLFQEYLPAGFSKLEKTAYEKLENEAAWR